MSDLPTIADHMTTEVITFEIDLPIFNAVTTLVRRQISGAPVVDASGALVGIITAKDCFKAALHASYYQGWSGVVRDFMTKRVETLDAQLDIVSAARRFQDSSFRRYPVMSDGRLVGVLTRLDLLKALCTQL